MESLLGERRVVAVLLLNCEGCQEVLLQCAAGNSVVEGVVELLEHLKVIHCILVLGGRSGCGDSLLEGLCQVLLLLYLFFDH